jgi:hypothetical protein
VEGARIEPVGSFGEEPPALRSGPGITDASGETSFVLDHGGRACTHYVASRPGWLLARGLADRGSTTVLRLRRGIPVSGRVVRAGTAAPVRGAVVRAWVAKDAEETCLPATTDEEGRFTLGAVPPGERVAVVAKTPGLFAVRVLGTFEESPESLELVVGGGGTVEGRVIGPAGDPRAGVTVWLLKPGFPIPPRRQGGHWVVEGGYRHYLDFVLARVVTDKHGTFRFDGVPVGMDRIAVAKLSENTEIESEIVRLEQNGETVRCDVLLPRLAQVTVEVRGDAGEILRRVQVDFVRPRLWFDGRNQGAPDEEGRLVVPDVPPGDWLVRAWIPGAEAVEHEVRLVPGEARTLVFAPEEGAVLEGVVVDPAGKPVAFANLWIRKPHRTTHADASGRFRITGLPGGDPLALSVGPGFAPRDEMERPLAPVDLEGVRAGRKPLRIVLPFGGRVRGRIPGIAPGTDLRCRLYSRHISASGSIRIGGEGRFVRDAPRPGVPFLLRIDAAGHAPLIVECGPLETGEDLDLGELTLDAGHVLAGRVLGPDAEPVSGAEVKLVERWLDTSAVTGADGRFRLERLPARPIWARVVARGHPAWFVVFDPPDRAPEAVVRLSRGGSLSLEVRGADGAPAASGTLGIARDLEHPLDADLDDLHDYMRLTSGGKRHLRLQPGRYRLRAHSEDDAQGATTTVEIGEGQERTLRIDLAPTR